MLFVACHAFFNKQYRFCKSKSECDNNGATSPPTEINASDNLRSDMRKVLGTSINKWKNDKRGCRTPQSINGLCETSFDCEQHEGATFNNKEPEESQLVVAS